MTRTLFGTDGVRGLAGEVVTAELALALGRAATSLCGAERPRVLVIRDTRESGEMLEAAIAAGIAAEGGEALLAGVLPTPAAPLLLRRYGFDLAAVLSASHNPFCDNGIKFFGADGDKLSDATELEIERRLAAGPAASVATSAASAICTEASRTICVSCIVGSQRLTSPGAGSCWTAPTARPTWPRRRSSAASAPPSRRSPTLRTAATSTTAAGPRTSGRSPRRWSPAATTSGSPSMATATACSPSTARARWSTATSWWPWRRCTSSAAGRLAGGGVAVTVMTNFGFHRAMAEAGIEVATTQVGDRYVLEALREHGWTLGGEQSGHVIELGFAPSGDGIASALLTLEALAGADLADRGGMRKLPQRLVNVRVRDRTALAHAATVHGAIERESAELDGRGRVLIRPSGTEPLVRVMVEAPTEEEADAVCGRLVALVESELA